MLMTIVIVTIAVFSIGASMISIQISPKLSGSPIFLKLLLCDFGGVPVWSSPPVGCFANRGCS